MRLKEVSQGYPDYYQPIILNIHGKKQEKGLLLSDNIRVTKRYDEPVISREGWTSLGRDQHSAYEWCS